MERYQFASLDELLDRCRDPLSRRYIDEAIKCYRAGAVRASIVMAWQAVVFDIVAKLNELKLTGDKQATKIFNDFHNSIDNPKKAQEFESGIFDRVECLELLSTQERFDIERLRQDRHRCAHPSVNNPFEDYRPTPEQSRAHIRNAVEHLLSRPPVAGKSALKQLERVADLSSLPRDPAEVLLVLKSSPLARAKKTVIRNHLNFLIRRVLKNTEEKESRRRAILLIEATFQLHPETCCEVFKKEADQYLNYAQQQSHTSFARFFSILAVVPRMANYLSGVSVMFLKQHLLDPEREKRHLYWERAVKVPQLEEFLSEFIDTLDCAAFCKTCERNPPDSRFFNRALDFLEESRTFSMANRIGKACIVPMAELLNREDIEKIFEVAGINDQVGASQEIKNLAEILVKDKEILSFDELEELIESNSENHDLRAMMMFDEYYR